MKPASGPSCVSFTASASIIVSVGTRWQWPPVYGDFSSIALLISVMKDSNSASSWLTSWRLVSAMAACEARDSASWRSEPEKIPTAPVTGCTALISCSTPITAPSWFIIGTVRKLVER